MPAVNPRRGDRYRLPAPGCCQLSVHKHSFSTPALRGAPWSLALRVIRGRVRPQGDTGTHKVRRKGRKRVKKEARQRRKKVKKVEVKEAEHTARRDGRDGI